MGGERHWARDPHKLGFLNSRKDRCKDGVLLWDVEEFTFLINVTFNNFNKLMQLLFCVFYFLWHFSGFMSKYTHNM